MSWPMVAIKDVARVVTGKTPSTLESDNFGGDIPFITPSELGLEVYVTASPRTLSDKGVAEIKLVPKNAVMVCCIGSLGKLAIAGTAVATNQQINSVIFDDNKIDTKYGFYALQLLKPKMESMAPSTTVAIINKSNFEALQITLPPLPEQKRIAAILDKADAIRRKRQQAIQLADDFLRAVFLDMFGDPVTNPKGFKKAPITELADVITGFAFKSNKYVSDSNDSVRLCRGTNTLTGYFDWSDTAYWPKSMLEDLDGYLIREGDVILAMDRPWISSGLKVCVFPKNQRSTYLVQRVARLRPKDLAYTDYIHSCIKSQAFERHCCPTETTVPHISPIELKGFEVLIPDSALIKKYHNVVSLLNISAEKMSDNNKQNESLFHSLCQKSFSGRQ